LGKPWDQEECNQFCSQQELWEAARDEEMEISWQKANAGPPVPAYTPRISIRETQKRTFRSRVQCVFIMMMMSFICSCRNKNQPNTQMAVPRPEHAHASARPADATPRHVSRTHNNRMAKR
jgi:hypothetical protein